MVDSDTDNELDPIKASYDVYIKPHISEDCQVYILQFPNRDSKQNYSQSNDAQPFKMRVKGNAGMVELDVPLDAWRNYDRDKGIKWGESIRKSNMSKGGGSHGLPGGFGIGGATQSGRARGRAVDEEVDQDMLMKDYALAIESGQVLTTQTLGGQFVSSEDTTPRYMIGAFRKDQLHLTPVDHIVQMRPQFHHIDAQSEQERASRGRDPTIGGPAPQARAIHMTVKSTVDGEDNTTDTMSERITLTQAELWESHKYVDEEEGEAWTFYEENLFVGAEQKIENSAELKARMPALLTSLDNAEYMDTISAPTNPAKLSMSKKVRKDRDTKGKGKEKAVDAVGSDTSSTLSDPPTDSEDDVAVMRE